MVLMQIKNIKKCKILSLNYNELVYYYNFIYEFLIKSKRLKNSK